MPWFGSCCFGLLCGLCSGPEEYKSQAHISCLLPELLAAILGYIPMQHLIRLRLVCHQWKEVIEQYHCSSQFVSIALYDKRASIRTEAGAVIHSKWKLIDIVVPERRRTKHQPLPKELCELLPRLFPRLGQLTICRIENIESQLIPLLNQWSETLVTLAAYTFKPEFEGIKFAGSTELLNSLNELTALRTIQLDIPPECWLHLGPLLGRIEHLVIFNVLTEEQGFGMIGLLGPNCARLQFQARLTSSELIAETKARLEILNIGVPLGEEGCVGPMLRVIANADLRFSSLQMLDLTLGVNEMTFQHFNQFARLKSLAELHLQPVRVLVEDLDSIETLSPLPNIKVLTLGCLSVDRRLLAQSETLQPLWSGLSRLLPEVLVLTVVPNQQNAIFEAVNPPADVQNAATNSFNMTKQVDAIYAYFKSLAKFRFPHPSGPPGQMLTLHFHYVDNVLDILRV